MKQRFSSLDVKIIAHELSTSLVSLRLANVYDLSSRIFLLKFAKPDRREQLVIDSGFRAHLTSFARTTAASPSPFIARLRKFLRTRRVTAVKQVGTDRILEITFSDGLYRLFLEFYAGGNIVLTDGECTILGLLRNVAEGAEHEQYKLGGKYDLELRQNFAGVPELTAERVREGLKRAVEKQREEAEKPGKKKVKVKEGDRLRKALAVTTTEFPPVLIEHVLLEGGFARETKPEEIVESEELLGRLVGCLERAGEVLKEITSAEVAKGYIVAKRKAGGAAVAQAQKEGEEKQEGGLLYDDFHPFKPAQLAGEGVEFLEYEGFNKAVDEFFSSIEGQRLESKLQEREDAAKRKIEQARQEQENRIQGLQQTADLNVQKAQAIEANVERVEEAVAAVNGLISQGMDWVDIGHLIKNEQSRQNAVAQTIKLPLKLHENTVTLLLSGYDDVADEEMADETDSEASDSEDEDAPTGKSRAKPEDKRLAVDIDLAQSPWANARLYYDQRRTATVKQEKTAQASVKALKSTEQKVMADLKKGLKQEKDVLRPVRRQMWFEKFTYFVSSDGYLVLAGKDVQQTETLYRRYLKKGDVYVHADLPGAASVIIKNNPATPEAPIPPSTLSQAGNLSVCTSSAWDNKAIMSAWWVLGEHVAKIAPTGDFLPAGTFNIKTKKNYLPPAQLLLGFGVLFQISEDSKARHFKNRLGDATLSAAGDGQSAEQQAIEELAQEKDDEDDEDDEFPDAGREAVENGPGDDEDDDFPDAQDEQEHEDHEPAVRSNPLQSKGTAADDEDEDSDDDNSDDEQEEPQPDPNEQTETEEPAQADQPKNKGGKAGGKAEPRQQQQPKKMTRGKRGKAKRQAAKYAEQDDEDRELAMKLLGSRAAEERREAEAAQKAVEKESAEEARARRRAQHEKAQKEGLAAEELRRLTLEEGGQDLDDEEAAQMALLDSFVGTPLPGDEILEAIPVCAPWTAMAKYKYKVKMQPGAQKKGKAIREILTVWNRAGSEKKNVDVSAQDKEMIWPREAELVRGLKEVEVVGIIPVKSLRVVISGGSSGGGGGDKGKGGAKSRGQKKGRGGKGSKKK